MATSIGTLYLGCPVWAQANWRGALYTSDARREDFLPQYARVFGAVEGSATFYALPGETTVRRWADGTPQGFRFVFKFPRAVTHDRKLIDAHACTDSFLARMALLPERLGPLLIQLGPDFGARDLPTLADFLRALPDSFDYVVEVRHPDFFDDGPNEAALAVLLAARGIARGNLDTTQVFESPDRDDSTRRAQYEKPRVPRRAVHVAGPALVRFVGENEIARCDAALDFWVDQVGSWLERGIDVYFFAHAPDDINAPALARRFHARLATRVGSLPALAPFPGETGPVEPRQADLF